MAMLIHDQTYK